MGERMGIESPLHLNIEKKLVSQSETVDPVRRLCFPKKSLPLLLVLENVDV